MDFNELVMQMPVAVPMVKTLGLEFLELDPPGRVLLRMADQPAYHNHVGGLHAGAMFTLAETASGALCLGNFGGMGDRVLPLPVTSTINFRKIAHGTMYAEAILRQTPEEILAIMDGGTRPEFPVEVTLSTEDGTATGDATFIWTLKLLRR